jgi:TolB-like protein
MSGDPEQEYFADGMVEEIITALSRIRWLFVIARNSSFSYRATRSGIMPQFNAATAIRSGAKTLNEGPVVRPVQGHRCDC